MASWGGLLGGEGSGGGVIEQLFVWQVLGQLISAVATPAFTAVTQDVWKAAVDLGVAQQLSPSLVADAVVRGFLDQPTAAGIAAQSGVAPDEFQTMVDLAGDAPAPGQLAVALRRGLISETGAGPSSTSFEAGIREGRLADKWTEMIKGLSQEWPTPTDALQALLQGQVDQATGQALYERFGGDPDYFQLLYNTRGNAPTPMEALRMLNRGIIPASGTGPTSTSFEQAFLEGPWRNKWLKPFQDLGVYVPPPRTITTLQTHGVITDAQAAKYYAEQGMTPELANIYTRSATAAKVVTNKALAESNVLKLYYEKLIDAGQATTMLADLGYSGPEAKYLLELQDFSRALSAYNSAITRVGSLYVGHKIDRQSAQDALGKLDVPADAVAHLMTTWDAEVAANVHTLTPAQVADALFYAVIPQAEAQTMLEQMGYTPHDAWVVLSVRAHAPLPDEPPRGPLSGGATPVTGG